MARIPLKQNHDVDGDAAAVFAEVEQAYGMVPNGFRAYAHHPPLLRANWEKAKALMTDGHLDRRFKEMLAVAVSSDNGCEYCVTNRGRALLSLDMPESVVRALQEGDQSAGLDDREAELLQFVVKANRAALSVSDADVAKVRAAGWSDAELVEALGVMELFTGVNRFLDTMQIDIEG